MPHYKDQTNRVHFIEEEEFEYLLPEGCVQISDEEAKAALPLTFADVKAAKLSEINAECDRQIESIRSTYPETEIMSWYRQETEARALAADPAALTPLVDGIAIERGQTREELAYLIIAKSNSFASLTAPIFGTRQVLEKQIEAATTVEQVNEIVWT